MTLDRRAWVVKRSRSAPIRRAPNRYIGGRIVGKITSAGFGCRIGCPMAIAKVDIARQMWLGRVILRQYST
jgi:glycine cleavage system aminomethyltransferase T